MHLLFSLSFYVCVLYIRLFIDFLNKGIICTDLYIKSLDYSADIINKKGRVNCTIKSCHCTCAVTKMSPSIVVFHLIWRNDAEVDCDRPLLSPCNLVCPM